MPVESLFTDPAVRTALSVGPLVAVTSGVVGVFTVMRGQSFAGEALADVGATGGSGAVLVGATPLLGFVVVGAVAAGLMELVGTRRRGGRDLATGIVLGAGLGLAALFLYLDANQADASGTTAAILFGSLFTVDPSTVAPIVALAGLCLAGVLVLYRPLILSSVSTDLASARGVSVRLIGTAYLLVVVLSVALASVTIGAVLSTALLVGPAATALRLSDRPGIAAAWAALVGAAAVTGGVALSYESYYWPPTGQGWPVSFFVVALVLVGYLLAGVAARFCHGGAPGAGPGSR